MNSETSGLLCRETRALLHALQADELSENRKAEVQRHLENCPGCARFLRLESALDATLAARLKKRDLPEGFEARLRGALESEPRGDPRFAATWKWAAAVAAAALVVFASIAIEGRWRDRRGVAPEAAPAGTEQVLAGTLVCGSCEREGGRGVARKTCDRFGHLGALKCEDGRLLQLVGTDLSRALTDDASRLGERIEVRGVVLDSEASVRVSSFRYLGKGRAQEGS